MTLLALQYVVYIVRKITLFRAKHSAVVVPEKSETAENAGAEA
jgi:hypothetical protein